MPGQATQPTTLRGAVECLSNITSLKRHLIPWDALEQAVKAQDVLAAVAKQASDLLWQWHEGLTPLDANGVHDAVQALDAAVDATEPTFDMNQQAEKLVDEEGNVRLGIVDSEGTEYVIRAMTEEEKSAN